MYTDRCWLDISLGLVAQQGEDGAEYDFTTASYATPYSAERIVAGGDLATRPLDHLGAWAPWISEDGYRIVFPTVAALVPEDTNGKIDLYLKDFTTGALARVSTGVDGTQADGDSLFATLSDDGTRLLFWSAAGNLVAGDTNGQFDVFLKNLQTGAIQRVSTRADGGETHNLYEPESFPMFSPDGQSVLFASPAGDLVPGDTNGTYDAFIKSLASGDVQRVSLGSDGLTQGDRYSMYPWFSPDGRKVTFYTDATNFAPNDSIAFLDVYVKNLDTGELTRASTSSSGIPANGDCEDPMFSADGGSVYFTSIADNLVAGDTNGAWDIFRKNLTTGEVIRVSVAVDGSEATGGSGMPGYPEFTGNWLTSLSADGRYIAFLSDATNLVPGDTNGIFDVFVKDLVSGEVARVSVGSDGVEANGFSGPARLSADGRYLVFESVASNLVAEDTNGLSDFFRVVNPFVPPADTTPPALTGISPAPGAVGVSVAQNIVATFGEPIQRGAGHVVLRNAATGVAVEAYDVATNTTNLSVLGAVVTVDPSANLLHGAHYRLDFDPGSVKDAAGNAFVGITQYDFTTEGFPTPASVERIVANGDLATSQSTRVDEWAPSLSGDGRLVVFPTIAALVPEDTNGTADLYLKDCATGAVARVSTGAAGVQANDACLYGKLSADGTWLLFSSAASNLVPGDTNGQIDLFLKNLATGTIERISTRADGGEVHNAGSGEMYSSFSGDGRQVLFASGASDLVPDDTNHAYDIFIKDLASGAVQRVSVGSDGVTQGNGSSNDPFWSADGRWVAFTSRATNFVADDDASAKDIFVKDLQTGALTRASTSSMGVPANGDCNGAGLSPDGRFVYFTSIADNLVAGDTNNAWDVFRKDLITGEVARISVAADGTQAVRGGGLPADPGSSGSWLTGGSADGRYLTFVSDATNLVPGDTNGVVDVFVADILTGELARVTVDVAGVQANGFSVAASMSADSRYVVFESVASNLVAGDTNGLSDFFRVANPFVLPAADTVAPTLSEIRPADGAVGVDVGENIVAIFSEPIQRATGQVVLRNAATGIAVETYDIATNFFNLGVASRVLVVDPSADLTYGTRYRLDFEPGSLRDAAGNAYPGTASYDFTTDDYAGSTSTAGLLAAGRSATGSVDRAGDHDWFASTLLQGSRYEFSLAAPTLGWPTLILRSADGALVQGESGGAAGGTVTFSFEPSRSGTYYLDVFDTGSGSGTYMLHATSVPVIDDYPAGTTTAGVVPIGGGAAGHVETAGDADWFAVTLAAGASYRFRLDGTGLADPLLTLRSTAGAWLTSDDNSGGGKAAQIDFTAASGGVYYLEAADAHGGTGAYAVTAVGTAADDYADDLSTHGQLASGEALTGTIEVAGDVDWFAVPLVALTRYVFRLDATAGAGAALPDPWLTLSTVAGAVLASDNGHGSGTGAQIEYVADRTGTFYLAARDLGEGIGHYTVSTSAVTTDDYTANPQTSGRVAVGGVARGWIDWTNDHDWFGVELQAGATYQFRLTSTGLDDPLLTLYSPEGTALLSDDDGGGGRNALVHFTAPGTGLYFLDAADSASLTGTYVVSALRVPDDDYADDDSTIGRLVAGTPSTGRIETPGDVDWFAFEATAGTRYQFFLVGDGGNDPYLSLCTSPGTVLVSSNDGGGGRAASFVYDAVGSQTLYLAASDASTAIGGYTLSAAAARSDDYAADPGTLGQVAVGGSVGGSVQFHGDHDWFAVSLSAGQAYRFDLDGVGLANPSLSLYSDAHMAVGWNDDRAVGDPGATIVYTAPSSGTYWLDAYAHGTGTGGYTLSAATTSPPDDYASDASTTGRVAVEGGMIGRIETVGDVDWFAVTLSANVAYEFRLDSRGIVDPYLAVYGAQGGTPLNTADDGGSANNALLRFTPPVSGPYYLAASDLACSTGGYLLQAAFDPVPTDSAYSIALNFEFPVGDPRYARYEAYFTAAAHRWERVITSDLPDAVVDGYGRIDDLLIDVRLVSIDGPGGHYGGGAVSDLRTEVDGGLPARGHIDLDVADLAGLERTGTLLSLIEHEMGHVLGFTHWALPKWGLVDDSSAPYRYIGANALEQYRQLAGDQSLAFVPIEQDGSAGERGCHLDDETFGRELMSTWMEGDPPQPLSVVTIGVLQDLGYAVDYGAADPFVLPPS